MMRMHCSKDNVGQVANHCSVGLGTWHGNSKSIGSGEVLIPKTKPHPHKQGSKHDAKKCKAYVPLLIIQLDGCGKQHKPQKENQTRQKLVLNQISRSDILGMDCKKHQSRMNIYTGSNDVLYWLYNSQQISKGKTGIYL